MKHMRHLVMAFLLVVLSPCLQAQITETFSFTGLNRPIPDGNAAGLSHVTNLTSAISCITSVKVRLHVAGEFNGDLYGYVTHSNGFTVLLNRPGRTAANAAGYDDAGLNITFDDAAANGDVHLYQSVVTPSIGVPLTGSWWPDGRNVDPGVVTDATNRTTSLAVFNNLAASGGWTLYLADLESGGTNLLASWELEITGLGTPLVSWLTPTDIVYGTALDVAQLNATASVAGSFAYSPTAGTVLDSGNSRALSTVFTPADPASYKSVTNSVLLNVTKALLAVTADNQSKIYGAALPALTGVISGLQNSDAITANYTTAANGASPVGTYDIVPAPVGPLVTNYTVALTNGTLTITPAATVGIVSSSSNPALPGQPVIFRLVVVTVGPGVGTPTGTVDFRINGSASGSPAEVVGGIAYYTNATLALGTHTVVAEYAGDGNFTGTTNSLTPVQLINTPPIAASDTIERYPTNGVKVSIAALLSNDSDADNDSLMFVAVSATSTNGGTVLRSGNWIYYTPLAGFTNVDAFSYTLSDGRGSNVTGTVLVNIKVDNSMAQNLAITQFAPHQFQLRFNGIPGRTYHIQHTDSLSPIEWLPLGLGTANELGIFEYIDTTPEGVTERFYRSVYP